MYIVNNSSYKYEDLLRYDYEFICKLATGITKNKVEDMKFMGRIVNLALINPKEIGKIIVEYKGKKEKERKQLRPIQLRNMGFKESKRKK